MIWRSLFMVLVLVAFAFIWFTSLGDGAKFFFFGWNAAHAAEAFACKDAGPCMCTESESPKGVLGYAPTDDRLSVNVAITCINMKTMSAAYYTARREGGLGASYTSTPVPHD